MMNKQVGFSLIELMVVVATVAVLATLAFPAFTNYISKARRTDAQQVLLAMANDQATWRSSNAAYASFVQLGSPIIGHYINPTVTDITATTYTLTATAVVGDSQANDREQGTLCSPLVYGLNGTTVTKTPAICWAR